MSGGRNPRKREWGCPARRRGTIDPSGSLRRSWASRRRWSSSLYPGNVHEGTIEGAGAGEGEGGRRGEGEGKGEEGEGRREEGEGEGQVEHGGSYGPWFG